jgi:CMP-N-acetylneuraminic acid synthetase
MRKKCIDNRQAIRTGAVIPIRYRDCCSPETNLARHHLEGRPLWAFTLDHACQSNSMSTIIVAYDNDAFLPHLEPWKDNIELLKRPSYLSEQNYTVMDVLRYVSGEIAHSASNFLTNLMLMEITHPLRPPSLIDELIKTAERTSASALVPCKPSKYTYWRQKAHDIPVERLKGTGECPEIVMWREVLGLGAVFSLKALLDETHFTENVVLIPIDEGWAAIDATEDMLVNGKVKKYYSS